MITEIRCSGLARPMECAGFLYMQNLPESEDTEPARQGTAYGELVQRYILGGEIPKQAKNGVYFDHDMHFYAKSAAEEVNSDRQSEVRCEQSIDWQTRSGIWIRGSYDTSFVRKTRLTIDDDKWGWGIVEVRPNWQLLGYAIGEILRRNEYFPEIVLRIKQPRPHHEDGPIREWILSYAELLEYKEKIEQRMEMIAAGNKTLQTGKHCKYCGACAEACPAFNRLFYRALEVTTEFTQDRIDEAELARQLDQVARAEEVLKIKKSSIQELAVSRIKEGKLIPGWLTQDNFGNRNWKEGTDPAVLEALTGRKVTKEEMLSPAQVEKLGIKKEFVNAFVERKYLGQKLVRRDGSDVGNRIFGKAAPL